VDADWTRAPAPQSIPAIVADAEGVLRWCGGTPVSVPRGLDPETAAGLALLDVARAAVAALGKSSPGSVEVNGVGIVARLVRALLPASASATNGSGPERPSAVIDATGNQDDIKDATHRLADGGTLVLAGETLGRRLTLEVYPDIHVRGLKLVGVEPPLHGGELGVSAVDDDHLIILRECLSTVASGRRVPPGAGWYRIVF
jgi:threonine dehydrogenase-like Zn-dependent dehydrogenase